MIGYDCCRNDDSVLMSAHNASSTVCYLGFDTMKSNNLIENIIPVIVIGVFFRCVMNE